jgi:hypothetical protein
LYAHFQQASCQKQQLLPLPFFQAVLTCLKWCACLAMRDLFLCGTDHCPLLTLCMCGWAIVCHAAVLADGLGSRVAACVQAREATEQVLEGERGAAAAREKARDAEVDHLRADLKAAQQAHDMVSVRMARCSES